MNRRLALFLTLAVSTGAAGQTTPISPRATGMVDAGGSILRGPAGAIYNPGNLGLPGNPKFSLEIPAVGVSYGSAPISLKEIKNYENEIIPDDVKSEWLDRIRSEGGYQLAVEGVARGIGVSFGRFAFNILGAGVGRGNIPPDAAELLLFGNAGEDGDPSDLTFDNGRASGFALSYVMASYGRVVMRKEQGGSTRLLSIGASAKYAMGHAYANMWQVDGTVSGDPLESDITFPVVSITPDGGFKVADGFGLDVGAAYQQGRLTLGFSVTDLVNTLTWDPDKAFVRDGSAVVNDDSSAANFAKRPLDDPSVDPEIRDRAIEELKNAELDPVLRASAAYRFRDNLTLVGEFLHRTGDRVIQPDAKTSVGVGAEYRPIQMLPVRAGFALITGGARWSLGAGIEFWGMRLDLAFGQRYSNDIGDTRQLAAGLTIGGIGP